MRSKGEVRKPQARIGQAIGGVEAYSIGDRFLSTGCKKKAVCGEIEMSKKSGRSNPPVGKSLWGRGGMVDATDLEN